MEYSHLEDSNVKSKRLSKMFIYLGVVVLIAILGVSLLLIFSNGSQEDLEDDSLENYYTTPKTNVSSPADNLLNDSEESSSQESTPSSAPLIENETKSSPQSPSNVNISSPADEGLDEGPEEGNQLPPVLELSSPADDALPNP